MDGNRGQCGMPIKWSSFLIVAYQLRGLAEVGAWAWGSLARALSILRFKHPHQEGNSDNTVIATHVILVKIDKRFVNDS